MAKKKTVKKTKETSEPAETVIHHNQTNQVDYLVMFDKINKRIDAIVSAIDKSKTVRGL